MSISMSGVKEPNRPKMPTQEDNRRARHQMQRYSILKDDWDITLKEYVDSRIDKQTASVWGQPDTATNPLANLCRQYTTPGLYGETPIIRMSEGSQSAIDRADELIGSDGIMSKAKAFTRLRHVQYLSVGMGEVFLRTSIIKGKPYYRVVFPHNVFVKWLPETPTEPQELWELRMRPLIKAHNGKVFKKEWVYTWDIYDLGNDVTPPSFRVIDANAFENGELKDLTHHFFGDIEEYPWIYEGKAFLPYVVYRSTDTGQFWNHYDKRGVHRGTLNAALFATYTAHAALFATGSFVIVAGLQLSSVDATTDNAHGNSTKVARITPGCIITATITDAQQPFVTEIGPGSNLPSLAKFQADYVSNLLQSWGLSNDSVTRNQANPTSAAALSITNESKRLFGKQVTPFFRCADLELIALTAKLMNIYLGKKRYTTTGYTIQYLGVPLSGEEKKAIREDIEWQVKNGFMSLVTAYRMLYPGTSEKDAMFAMAQAKADERSIEELAAGMFSRFMGEQNQGANQMISEEKADDLTDSNSEKEEV